MTVGIGRALAVATLVLVSGCGGPTRPSAHQAPTSGGSATSVSPAPSPSPSPPALAPEVRAALARRVAASPRLPGEEVAKPASYETIGDYVANDDGPYGEAYLRAAGFQGAAVQHLIVLGARGGAVREVLAFGSAAAARDIVSGLRIRPPYQFRQHPVPGVPGATVNEVSDEAGTVLARNVTFTAGRYECLLGAVPGTQDAPSRAVLARAAARWYVRVRSQV